MFLQSAILLVSWGRDTIVGEGNWASLNRYIPNAITVTYFPTAMRLTWPFFAKVCPVCLTRWTDVLAKAAILLRNRFRASHLKALTNACNMRGDTLANSFTFRLTNIRTCASRFVYILYTQYSIVTRFIRLWQIMLEDAARYIVRVHLHALTINNEHLHTMIVF